MLAGTKRKLDSRVYHVGYARAPKEWHPKIGGSVILNCKGRCLPREDKGILACSSTLPEHSFSLEAESEIEETRASGVKST
jgi:hypothetical protein